MSVEQEQDLEQNLEQNLEQDLEQDLEPEVNEIEQEAMVQGWNPDGVEGKRKLTAEEFLDRKPLYDKLHKSDREMRRLREQQEALQQHLGMLRKNLTDEKIKELKKQKKEALEEQEHDRVMEIDEEIIKARTEESEVPARPDTSDFDSWLENNTWYENDKTMKRYADAVGAEFANSHGKLTPALLKQIAEEVKEAFPDRFSKKRTNTVEAATRSRQPAKGAKHTVRDLDDTGRQVMRTLIRNGTYASEAEYIKDLETSGYFG